MSPWKRFPEQARKVVIAAQEEAEAEGAVELQTPHLLLGIISEAGSRAVDLLGELGFEPRHVRDEVGKLVASASRAGVQLGADECELAAERQFSDQAKRVLQQAYNEVRKLNHSYVGAEHLLLGLLYDDDDVAARILQSFGIDVADVRRRVAAMGDTS